MTSSFTLFGVDADVVMKLAVINTSHGRRAQLHVEQDLGDVPPYGEVTVVNDMMFDRVQLRQLRRELRRLARDLRRAP